MIIGLEITSPLGSGDTLYIFSYELFNTMCLEITSPLGSGDTAMLWELIGIGYTVLILNNDDVIEHSHKSSQTYIYLCLKLRPYYIQIALK